VNNVLVSQWPFSYQSGSTTGTKQLGGVDLFAGAQTGETPKYYFDDVYFAALAPPMEPQIQVSPTSLQAYMLPNTTSTANFSVSNLGTADLTGSAIVILNSDKLAPVKPSGTLSLSTSDISAGPVLQGGAPVSDATAVLHYDGDNNSAIGWSSAPVTVTVAAMFPNSMTLPYAGMHITSVDVYINNLNTTGSNQMKIKIYGMGTTYEPGPLLYEQNFTPAGSSWEHVVLTTPVLVTGQDLWVGYQFTQNETGIYIPGCDAGPNHPYGDFLSTGVGWSHLSNNPNLPYNWNIRANLEGDVFPQWLSVAPTTFTVAPGGAQDFTVTFNSTNLPIGVHEGIIRILSNDVNNPSVDVNCVLSCSVGIDESEKVAVLVYPNPAKDRIMIQSSHQVKEVRITSPTGKLMYRGNLLSVDVSKFPTGVYFIQTTTTAGTTNVKFMKE
ncbi:MAG: T9SS type A sorting domain-containing protein, partial [Bacteroidales bacterium]